MLVPKCPRSHNGVFFFFFFFFVCVLCCVVLCCVVLFWVVRVQSELLYGVNNKLADKISNFNRYEID